MCNNFVHLPNLAFQCDFSCKTCVTKYDHQNLICKGLPTPLDTKKNGSQTRMTFPTHKQMFPSKKSHFWR